MRFRKGPCGECRAPAVSGGPPRWFRKPAREPEWLRWAAESEMAQPASRLVSRLESEIAPRQRRFANHPAAVEKGQGTRRRAVRVRIPPIESIAPANRART